MSKETPKPNAKNATKSALKKVAWLTLIAGGLLLVSLIMGDRTQTSSELSLTINRQSYLQTIVFDSGAEFSQTETVVSAYDRQKGLSGRQKLTDDQAMLFIFDQPGHPGIWMKGMKIPIDIIWLNCAGQITHINKNVSPDTYPKVFKPRRQAQFVLEVRAGITDDKNIKAGDRALFTTTYDNVWLGCSRPPLQ